jgi:mycothiol synthase
MTPQDDFPQLLMGWPDIRISGPVPDINLSAGYQIRTFQPGDEWRLCELMTIPGWPVWQTGMLAPWHKRMLPDGWHVAVEKNSGLITASCMAIWSDVYFGGGELAWLVTDPNHSGQGLATALATAVTVHFIRTKVNHIHLFTEHYRLAALKIYLQMGYVPLIKSADVLAPWWEVCRRLGWEYAPERWQAATHSYYRNTSVE